MTLTAATEDKRAAHLTAMAELEAARVVLAAERSALDAAREALRAEGERLRSDLAVQMSTVAPSLAAVLESRGVTGAAEQERLLGALAGAQRLRALIPHLKVAEVAAVAHLLEEPVVLPSPHPSVPADLDADLPVGADLGLARIGERAMLLGLRRLVIVGGNPRLHKFFRDAFDARIELRFRAAGSRPRVRADAEVDVTRSDVVILWGVTPDPEAQRIYQTSRAVVVEVAGVTLADLLSAVHRRLDEV